MLDSQKPVVVMGLMDRRSIAFAIGQAIQEHGGRIVYTVQNAVVKKRYLDKTLSEDETRALEYRLCDVSKEDEVAAVFSELNDIAGVVHSLAFANPKTCLGEDLNADAMEDIKRSYEISCASLATVAQHAVPAMKDGGAMVALTFESRRAFPYYNWMGVHKAALEALVRALARQHGRDGVRVNAVSAGPVDTTGASKIPGFDELKARWEASSLLPWDPAKDKAAVADAVVFLLSSMARRVTGQTLFVDGGASVVGGDLLDFEKGGR